MQIKLNMSSPVYAKEWEIDICCMQGCMQVLSFSSANSLVNIVSPQLPEVVLVLVMKPTFGTCVMILFYKMIKLISL